jgi:hypothetical protein
MITDALLINSAHWDCFVTEQLDDSIKSMGILNIKWAVCPPFNSSAATPEDAMHRTINPEYHT